MQASTTETGMEVFTRGKIEIQAVTFDLDDTLYDNLPVIKSAVAAMFAELDRAHPEIEVSPDAFRAEMIGPQKEQSPDGGADLGALRHRTLAFFARKAGHARPEAVADEIMKVFMRERSRVTLFPGVLSTLAALKQRGLVLGAITNGNCGVKEHAPVLAGLLDFVVSAADAGAPKVRLALRHGASARSAHVFERADDPPTARFVSSSRCPQPRWAPLLTAQALSGVDLRETASGSMERLL